MFCDLGMGVWVFGCFTRGVGVWVLCKRGND